MERERRTQQGWDDIDSAASPETLLAFLDALAAVPSMRAAKGRSFALLAARPGHRLLDAGCGTGVDAIALAPEVLPDGEVIGVDVSALAVEAARRNARGHPGMRFLRAEATALPFPDGWFDAARADRVIQHVAEPDAAVRELVRVTRPGGSVVITEATFALDRGPRPLRRVSSRHLLPFLPVFLKRAGAGTISVERIDLTLDLSPELAAVLAPVEGPIAVRVVHVRGVIERAPSGGSGSPAA